MSWRRLPFTQVDAFTNKAFGGNPAAVIPLDEWLSDTMLQAIAAEINLSETAFLVPDESSSADYELRWFTPKVEVPLCGHATLASGHVLLSSAQWRSEMRFSTRQAGVLTVRRDEEQLYHLSLPTYRAQPNGLEHLDPSIAQIVGVTPIETLWHDNGFALLVLETAQQVRDAQPDFKALAKLGNFQTIITAKGDGDASRADIVSRVFVPAIGLDEDPVTGSAHCCLTPYWTETLGQTTFRAFQASQRGGHIHCTVVGDRAELSGQCVTTITGEFHL